LDRRRQAVLLLGFFIVPSKGNDSVQEGGRAVVPQLWKTILKCCQSATYSRCKWLFCHSFDLFSFTVERAVNKLVAVGYKPLYTGLSGWRSIFDQRFRPLF
jgi:hypothetical protein